MAKRFRRKLVRRRRRFKRKRRMTIKQDPFPNTRLAKLTYCTQVSVNPASSFIGDHVFRLNSIFDPDFTGTGHQPYGHDTYELLYEQYRVVGCKATVTYSASAATSNIIALAEITPNSVSASSAEPVMERSNVKWKVSETNSPITLVMKWSAKNWFRGNVSANAQGAGFGSNPTEVAFLHLMAGSAAAGAASGQVNFNVKLEYIVRMAEIKVLAQS